MNGLNYISILDDVEKYRQECLLQVNEKWAVLLSEVVTRQVSDVNNAERHVWSALMLLGCSLLSLWYSHRLPARALVLLVTSKGRYRFDSLSKGILRSRFGEMQILRRRYKRISGKGPLEISPDDRRIGLAPGRMTLGVHFLVGFLSARMAFDEMLSVMNHYSVYVPGKRASLGIVDSLGPQARSYLSSLGPPDDDGEILVIQVDSKGAPMLRPDEHRKRCRPHKKRPAGTSKRGVRRIKRKENPKPRRKRGDKSKNARMGNVAVIYTLRRMPDGSLEGPINRRVISTFSGLGEFRTMLIHEATQRGYGQKKTIFLADGATWIWKLQQEHFQSATACLDWYHLLEYIWEAGATAHREGSKALSEWVKERKDELRTDQIDEVLDALYGLWKRHEENGKTGKKMKVDAAMDYILNHIEQLNYRQLLADDIDIATGAVEGAVKHLIGARLDGQGMRWSIERAEHVLALRLVVINQLWNDFERYCERNLLKIVELEIPSFSPTGVE